MKSMMVVLRFFLSAHFWPGHEKRKKKINKVKEKNYSISCLKNDNFYETFYGTQKAKRFFL